MMENKYYTPTINEFHMGFEYEYYSEGLSELDVDGIHGWYKKIFSLDIEEGEQAHPVTGKIRVKILSKECIESLGYKVEVLDVGQDTNYDELNISINGASIGNFYFDLTIHNANIELFGIFFTIKNKSEFKRVLNQIGYSHLIN